MSQEQEQEQEKQLASKEYTAEDVHQDLQNGKYTGYYGGANSPWLALAETASGKDLHAICSQTTQDEVLIDSLDKHLRLASTQTRWNDIVTLDPKGMWANRPTISATTACMYIDEMRHLPKDGTIVREDGGIAVVKCAIEYAWNIPGMATRLGLDSSAMRTALSKYLQNPSLLDPDNKVLLPPTGGLTVYFFGDLAQLSNPSAETAVRVHDECNGSDVFGTDICTCRPYLMFAVQEAVACAQRGGVGVIAYFRKEGRSLGEVTKFRVYNARKNQKGGDCPEKYFMQTESIAGVRDARFQELMPDVLLWLGISRIDWLMSMSSEKYEAIVDARIRVMQRISIPDELVPEGASVEITAKISAGYHTDNVSSSDVRGRLRGLEAIRERCAKVFGLVEQGRGRHFSVHMDNLPVVVDAVVSCIKRDYPTLDIPHHSRLRHFDITPLEEKWRCSAKERVRRAIDLVTVSVLLDAGAGPVWSYTDSKGVSTGRSEGLALAALALFEQGLFSSDKAMPYRANALGLEMMRLERFEEGLQHSESNPLRGVEGRFTLLQNLAKAMRGHPEYFGHEVVRPGNVLDYVLDNVDDHQEVSVKVLWEAVVGGLEDVWPTTLTGVRRGDVWVYPPLKELGVVGSDMVPFHKLSQWLSLSIIEPLEEFGVVFTDMHLLTGLAEYRNGGLFVDYGVLELKDPLEAGRSHPVGSELVVEWRALTVILVDLCAKGVREAFGKSEREMPVYKVLEGGTWKAGRIVAKQKREDGSPPITIRSDGTVF